MRKALDGLYAAALSMAVLAIVAIATLVLIQVAGRVIDRTLVWAGAAPIGIAVPSLAEIGGFLFVAAAFLALPATLRSGTHVRVTMLAQNLPPAAARWLSVAVLLIATGLGIFAAWHSALQVADSWKFNSVSFGMVRIPLWLPQGAMTAGLVLFAVALADELWAALRGATPAFATAEAGRGVDETGGH
jgi:TRAP-type C4-dicarboxylate transport system permease small subunit